MKKRVLFSAALLVIALQLTTGCNDVRGKLQSAFGASDSAQVATADEPHPEDIPESARKLVNKNFIDDYKNYTIRLKDITDEVNYGHKTMPEERDVDIIVIHSSYHAAKDTFNTQGVINQFKRYDVAAHYLISRDGTVYQMVKEKDIAWQAGKSALPGTDRTNLNSTSIGIEVMSTKHNGPTKTQYEALTALVNSIRSRHDIKYLVRHADIAPTRRDDPWGFDWANFVRLVEGTGGGGFTYFTTKVKNIDSFK